MQKLTRRLKARLQELSAWRNRDIRPLEGLFYADDLAEPVRWRIGDRWPSRTFPVRMHFEFHIPPEWEGQPVMVQFAVGGEAMLFTDLRDIGGLTPYHHEHMLAERARAGEYYHLCVEAVPQRLLARPVEDPRLEEAYLILPDMEVRALYDDLAVAVDAAGHVGEDAGALLLDAAAEAFAQVSLPRSPAESYLAHVGGPMGGTNLSISLWDRRQFTAPALGLPDEQRVQLCLARERLSARVAEIRTQYPPVGDLVLTGHSHIDLAWLWPYAETRRKARRTFSTVLSLMRAYPEFTFNQSQAQLYEWMEQDNPQLFGEIRKRVEEGRWELVGGTWVEADGNLPSGEAWARQLLYGQRYLQDRFGMRAKVAWLPDSFGYSAALPQIFREGGLEYFFTTKISWSENNAPPYDLYWWEGLDGSRLLAHSVWNRDGYNGVVEAQDLRETWKNFKAKRQHTTSLFAFGRGDGGGGPSADMLENYKRLKDYPAMPRLRMGRVEDYYLGVSTRSLPVWTGEQYLELHRGTFTSQARIKMLNRRLEHVLHEAEAAATLASLEGAEYPYEELEACWKALLRNQFHDVLPGSGIHAVVKEAQEQMAGALGRAESMRRAALKRLGKSAGGRPGAAARVVVWNLTLEDRPLRVTFPDPGVGAFRLVAPDGDVIDHQVVAGEVLAAADVPVPGMGYMVLSVLPGAGADAPVPSAPLLAGERVLENEYLRVIVGEDGTLHSLFDKHNGREALADRGNQLWAYTDMPRDFDAWDVDVSYPQEGQEVRPVRPPEPVDCGPVRAGLRVVRKLGHSTIEQVYWLWAGSRRVEVETHVRWEERHTLLRALFPLAVRSHEAWYETAFGAVPRTTQRNTSWDVARFEVPGLRFVDMSESDYGVSVLNDAKYGHSACGNVVGMSLLRGPINPDPLADVGEHHFTYALYPHAGDWRQSTTAEAHDLNAPLQALVLPGNALGEPCRRYIGLEGKGLRLSALKRSEDGDSIVLRLYDAHGGRGRARLLLDGLPPMQAAQRANFVEDAGEPAALAGPLLPFEYHPFQVLSFMLKP